MKTKIPLICAGFPIFLMGLVIVCEFFNIFNPGYEFIVWPFGIVFLLIFWGLYLILPDQLSTVITYQKTEGFIRGAFPNEIGFVITLIISMVLLYWIGKGIEYIYLKRKASKMHS